MLAPPHLIISVSPSAASVPSNSYMSYSIAVQTMAAPRQRTRHQRRHRRLLLCAGGVHLGWIPVATAGKIRAARGVSALSYQAIPRTGDPVYLTLRHRSQNDSRPEGVTACILHAAYGITD